MMTSVWPSVVTPGINTLADSEIMMNSLDYWLDPGKYMVIIKIVGLSWRGLFITLERHACFMQR
jgi:hypothetical protein